MAVAITEYYPPWPGETAVSRYACLAATAGSWKPDNRGGMIQGIKEAHGGMPSMDSHVSRRTVKGYD